MNPPCPLLQSSHHARDTEQEELQTDEVAREEIQNAMLDLDSEVVS